MNSDERRASEQQSVDEYAGGALRLDGNAAGPQTGHALDHPN
jgi:hypothetical protein